jgi:hypothetical protein
MSLTDGAKALAVWNNQGLTNTPSKVRKRPRHLSRPAKLGLPIGEGEDCGLTPPSEPKVLKAGEKAEGATHS